MNRDEIIKLAREVKGAARTSATDGSLWLLSESHLERFAALVAEAEREACIDLVAFYGSPVDLEAAIRARGNT